MPAGRCRHGYGRKCQGTTSTVACHPGMFDSFKSVWASTDVHGKVLRFIITAPRVSRRSPPDAIIRDHGAAHPRGATPWDCVTGRPGRFSEKLWKRPHGKGRLSTRLAAGVTVSACLKMLYGTRHSIATTAGEADPSMVEPPPLFRRQTPSANRGAKFSDFHGGGRTFP